MLTAEEMASVKTLFGRTSSGWPDAFLTAGERAMLEVLRPTRAAEEAAFQLAGKRRYVELLVERFACSSLSAHIVLILLGFG